MLHAARSYRASETRSIDSNVLFAALRVNQCRARYISAPLRLCANK